MQNKKVDNKRGRDKVLLVGLILILLIVNGAVGGGGWGSNGNAELEAELDTRCSRGELHLYTTLKIFSEQEKIFLGVVAGRGGAAGEESNKTFSNLSRLKGGVNI